jgi:hypothetical protein
MGGLGQSSMIHNFRERLEFSIAASDEPFWREVYKKAFPKMVGMSLVDDLSMQKMGIDRIVELENRKQILVDEKKRETVYPDILLEYESADTTGSPGWMEKDLAIDYIAYAFMPTQRVYLFPWDILKRAWDHYKPEWKETYPIIPARNDGYTTYSVAVPIHILTKAVSTASIIQL